MLTPHITIVVATDRNGAIGKGNTLPWRHRGDMRMFKDLTTGGAVVMGSKTYRSMDCKPLPGRLNIVLTRDPTQFEEHTNMICVTSVEEAMAYEENGNLFIIGGAEVYKLFLPYADLVSLSRLDLVVDQPDAWLPRCDIDDQTKYKQMAVIHGPGEVHKDDCAWEHLLFQRIRVREPDTHHEAFDEETA